MSSHACPHSLLSPLVALSHVSDAPPPQVVLAHAARSATEAATHDPARIIARWTPLTGVVSEPAPSPSPSLAAAPNSAAGHNAAAAAGTPAAAVAHVTAAAVPSPAATTVARPTTAEGAHTTAAAAAAARAPAEFAQTVADFGRDGRLPPPQLPGHQHEANRHAREGGGETGAAGMGDGAARIGAPVVGQAAPDAR
jgi:hypothetical protein